MPVMKKWRAWCRNSQFAHEKSEQIIEATCKEEAFLALRAMDPKIKMQDFSLYKPLPCDEIPSLKL